MNHTAIGKKKFGKYRIAQNCGGVKLWRIDRFRAFGEENVGEFTVANSSYF